MAGKLIRKKMGYEDSKSARGEEEEMTFGVDRVPEEEDNEAAPVAGSGKSERKQVGCSLGSHLTPTWAAALIGSCRR